MAVTVGDVIRVAAIQKWDGQDDVVNVLHFEISAVPTPNDNPSLLADIADRVGNAWAIIEGALSNNLQPDNLTVFNVSDDTPVGITSWGGVYSGGTSSGEAAPTFAAALVLMSTALKRKQGRMYIGGLTEGATADSRLNGATAVDIATMFDTLRFNGPELNGTDMGLVVYSRGSGLASPITTIRVQSLLARMGTRKLGRGS